MKVELNDRAEIKGTLEMKIYRRGKLVETIEEKNIVVNGGRNRLAQLIGGKATAYVTQIGFGTNGATIPKISDVNLTNTFKKAIDSVTVDGPDVTFAWHLDEIEPAAGMDIHEFGLFTSDNVMVTRLMRARVIGKDVDMRIEGKYTLHF